MIDVLEASRLWDSKTQTVILAKGLLQYLPAVAATDLFRQCAECTGVNSRFVFTYVRKSKDGKYDIGKHPKFFLWMMNITNEPWLWFTNLNELPVLLNSTGWTYSTELSGSILRSGIEYFCAAVKSPD